MSDTSPKLYRRYTNLPVLIDMLAKQRLTIVGYDSWDDANDRYAMELFRRSDSNIKFLGAYCVATSASETFHQWKIFADGPSGVCVNFSGEKFRKFIANLPSKYVCRDVCYVAYKNGQEAQNELLLKAFGSIDRRNIPFVKRKGFADEKEFRILYHSDDETEKVHHINLDLDMIDSIVLSPFLHDGLIESVKSALRSLPGCPKKISKARMTNNRTWQQSLDRYLNTASEGGNA